MSWHRRCKQKVSISPNAPILPKDMIDSRGTTIVIQKAEVKDNVRTSMGVITKALTVELNIKGQRETFSYLFSLDKDPVTGSVARILSKTGAKNVQDLDKKTLDKLKNAEVLVTNKGGKLFWN